VGDYDSANAAAADESGFFVAGTWQTSATQSGSFIVKLNHTDGSTVWSVQAGGTGTATRNRNTKAMALSHNGTLLYVAGSICDSGVQIGSNKCHAYVETVSASNGSSLRLVTCGPGKMDEVRSIGLDSNGDLLLAGHTKGNLTDLHKDAKATQNNRYDYFLAKMNATTGGIQWSQQGKGPEDDVVNSLAIHQGNVYITGTSHYFSRPFAFWASFDLSNGDRKDNYNGLAGEAHSILTIPGLQGSDGPFLTGQNGKNLFVHKYEVGKGTVAKHTLTPPAGKMLSGGQAALITESVGGKMTGKALIIGGTQTTTASPSKKSFVLYRLELVNNCSSSACGQNGDCIDLVDDFMCRCHAGYDGDRCQNDVNECKSTPCQNMGSCLDGIASYTCFCPHGYTGVQCEIDFDDCDPNPCLHGSCNDLVGDFHCICDSGWEGKTCQQNVDDCKGIDCGLGVCRDLQEAYECECPAGFTGRNCEINIDDCTSNPCKNGGTCVDGITSYSCACPSGTSPPDCVDTVDECSQFPCLNGGHCVDGVGTFTCTCFQGFVGKRCELSAVYCASNPCQNGGICSDLLSGFYCSCPDGFNGKRCEVRNDPCQSSPCQNGGYCSNGDEGYVCDCPELYMGRACELIDVTQLHAIPVTTSNADYIAHVLNQATNNQVKSSDIPVFADVTEKLFAVRGLSETAIDHVFEAISSIVDSPQEVLNEAHTKANSSAVLSRALETFGEHVLRPSMRTVDILKENVALKAEIFDHPLPPTAHHLFYQVMPQKLIKDGPETLSVSAISNIDDLIADPEHHPNAVLQLPTSIVSQPITSQHKPVVLNTVALRDASLFPGLLPVDTTVYSQVLSVSVNNSMAHHLAEPVVFSLKLNGLAKTATKPRCVWWDYKALNNQGNWSETGCITLNSSLSKTGSAYINCSCNHLTNFAVLVDIQGFGTGTGNNSVPIAKEHERALHYITMTFGSLSMVSLGITIFLILIIKILRENQAMQILLNLCTALLLTMLFFVIGIESSKYGNWCRAAAILIHYFALASIMWMLMEGVNFYVNLVKVFGARSSKIVLKYSLVGWGVPFLIVLVAFIVDTQTDNGVYVNDLCWISSKGWFYGSFIAPVCIVVLANIIIFVLVAKAIKFAQSGIHDKYIWARKLKISVAVACMLGLSWVFLAFIWGSHDQRLVFEYLFVIFVTLQGFFIFLFNIILNREIHNLIQVARRQGLWRVIGASKKQMDEVQSLGSACDSISASGEYLFNRDASPKRSFWSRLFRSSKSPPNSDFTLSTMSTSVASDSTRSSGSRKNSTSSLKPVLLKKRDSRSVTKDKQVVCCPSANESGGSEYGVAPSPTDAFADLPYARVNTLFYDKPDGVGKN
jgi:hypothetical protein